MVPRLHAKGASFKGAAAYLLHDKDKAQTSERVAWTETRNLATNNADVAWRVMAATAMDQDRLKEEAGIKASGRKSNKSVLHFSLSWHEEEAKDLTPEEMRRAAYGALRALGADKHQAMIVAHSDEAQPHVHILVNRVSAEDGRMLSSSKEKLKLSEWAQEYEQQRGKVYCQQRVFNNAARDRGEYVRGEKSQARNVYEVENPANDNSAKAKAIKEELNRKAAELAAKARATAERHAREFAQLEERHRKRMEELEREAKRNTTIARDQVRKDYRQSWEYLFHEDQAERAQFDLRESKLFGKVQNAFKAIDFGAIVRGEDRRKAIGEAFQAFGDSGARLEALKKEQNDRAQELLAKQRAEEQQAAQRIEWQRQGELARNRELFTAERSQLVLFQQMDNAALKAHWRGHAQERSEAWEPLRREQERRQKLEEWRRYQQQAEAEKRAERQHSPAPDTSTTAEEEEPLHVRQAREADDAKRRAPYSTETLDPERRRRMEEFLGRAVGRSEEERQAESGSHSPALDPERERRIREFLDRGDRAQEMRRGQDPGEGRGNDDGGEGQSM